MFDLTILDTFLFDIDVVGQDDRYLSKITEVEFSQMGNSLWVPVTSETERYYKRFCTIIPLYADNRLMVVPTPCTIDTRAPALMILGVAATTIL